MYICTEEVCVHTIQCVYCVYMCIYMTHTHVQTCNVF